MSRLLDFFLEIYYGGRVYDGTNNGEEDYIGTLTYIVKASGAVSMCIKCRKHGCKRSIGASKNPFESGGIKWLMQGLTMDASAHTRCFDEVVCRP